MFECGSEWVHRLVDANSVANAMTIRCDELRDQHRLSAEQTASILAELANTEDMIAATLERRSHTSSARRDELAALSEQARTCANRLRYRLATLEAHLGRQ